jgi:hypothetical protein
MFRRILCILALCSTACSARQAPTLEPPSLASPSDAAPAAQALDRSVFARTPQGTLSELDLQEILKRPIELELPARVGVLPVIQAEDWRGPGPSYEMVSPALSAFANSLTADDSFALVTEMVPIPSGALGIEALREAAARYKLRYLILYREHVQQDSRGNGWATGYLTGVGALFLPGSTLSVDGYAEASLLDVKTGLLLFTVRQRLSDARRSTVWQRDRKLDQMQRTLALEVADALAKDTRTALVRLRVLWPDAPERDAPTPSDPVALHAP